MPRWTLGKAATALVGSIVDQLFDRVKARYLGPQTAKLKDERILIGYRPMLTLQGLYRLAALEESSKPDQATIDSLVTVAEGYLDASREKTKARVVAAVEQFLREAQQKKEGTDTAVVLGAALAMLWGATTTEVTRIVDTEATTARNLGTLEGITKINYGQGIDDPVVFFIVVRDSSLCDECRRVHLLEDGVTPRVFLLSEVSHGYFKRGGNYPCIGGLHPHCRCTLASLLPGYGFIAGALKYLGRDHREMAAQRG